MRTSSFVLPAAWLLLSSACGSDGDAYASAAEPGAAPQVTAADAHRSASHDAGGPAREHEPGFAADESFAWSTERFEVEAGTERYLCFSKTLEEDLVVDGYSTEGKPFLHHLIFARVNPRAPEPDGFAECDTAFRASWDPIFIAGAGKAKLAFPKDAGHKFPKGTQLMVQMHLLNTGDEKVEGAVGINMHRSLHTDPRPVSSYVFGTADVRLPAKQQTTLTGECKARERVQLIAGFPHMHLLGTSLTFEAGPSADKLKQVFKRDPYFFDNQAIEPVDVTLAPGDLTRVTCKYNNTLAHDVTYGESTNNEMCYFIGFAIDRTTTSGCLGSAPPAGTGSSEAH